MRPMTASISGAPWLRALPPAAALALLFAVFLASPPAHGAETADAAAVNVAGRQRMLTQRIVKAWCATGLEVLPERSRRQLETAMDTFERQLAWLAARELDANARTILAQARELWQGLRPVAGGDIERERAEELARRADALLNTSHRLVLQLEQADGSPVARLVNLSGRQRMLSQRMASLYFRRAWGLGGEQLEEELRLAMEEFLAGLQVLSAASQSTPEILEELAAVNLQWTWFEYAIGLQGARTWLLVVDDSSESILNSMEAITEMYEALAAQ